MCYLASQLDKGVHEPYGNWELLYGKVYNFYFMDKACISVSMCLSLDVYSTTVTK